MVSLGNVYKVLWRREAASVPVLSQRHHVSTKRQELPGKLGADQVVLAQPVSR